MPHIIPVEEAAHEELAIYFQANESQLLHYYEPDEGLFLAESPKVIRRALDAGYEPVSMLIEDRELTGAAEDILPLLKDIPIYTAPHAVMETITGYALTRGAICAMRRKTPLEPEAILRRAERVAVFDQVENPTNMGAMFRCAAALGMDAALVTPASTDPLYRRSIRVSMGTVFQLPWTYADAWPADSMAMLHRLGFTTMAMALKDRTIDLSDPAFRPEGKIAVILGNEGDGIPEETLALCKETVKIPMAHGVDSLNVASAAAIAFFVLGRRPKA
jgi:tRNA G18 (ribose-2'-O)-methylase SpoU